MYEVSETGLRKEPTEAKWPSGVMDKMQHHGEMEQNAFLATTGEDFRNIPENS